MARIRNRQANPENLGVPPLNKTPVEAAEETPFKQPLPPGQPVETEQEFTPLPGQNLWAGHTYTTINFRARDDFLTRIQEELDHLTVPGGPKLTRTDFLHVAVRLLTQELENARLTGNEERTNQIRLMMKDL